MKEEQKQIFIEYVNKSNISVNHSAYVSYEEMNEILCKDFSIIMEICACVNVLPQEASIFASDYLHQQKNITNGLSNKLFGIYTFLRDTEFVKDELNKLITFLDKEHEQLEKKIIDKNEEKDFKEYLKISQSLIRLNMWRNKMNESNVICLEHKSKGEPNE